jgi:hypothetical protein
MRSILVEASKMFWMVNRGRGVSRGRSKIFIFPITPYIASPDI